MAFDENTDVVEETGAEPIPEEDDEAWLPEEDDNIESDESAEEELETEDTKPTETELPKKLKFKAKLLDGEKDVELAEAELPTVYQKANNHDRIREKLTTVETQNKELTEQINRGNALAKSKGYADYKAMLEAEETLEEENEAERLSPGNPELGKEMIKLRKQVQAKATTPEPPAPAAETPKSIRNFKVEIADVAEEYPDYSTYGGGVPKEVAEKAVSSGKPLIVAYAKWRASEAERAKTETLKTNKILQTNEANRAKAPVKSVKGGIEKSDPFESGFDSEY